MNSNARSSRAFTLIELLVVIGIITLLIAVLLPTLQKARQQAQMVACASNERQIYQALVMYGDEYNGAMPIPPTGGYPGTVAFPNQMWGMTAPSDYDYASDGLLWPYLTNDPIRRQQLLLCPADGPDRPQALSELPPRYNTAGQRNFSYSFNRFFVINAPGTVLTNIGRVQALTALKFSRILHADNKLLLLEPEAPVGGTDIIVSVPSGSMQLYCTLSTRHFGLDNECFADGHVELFDPKQILRQGNHFILLDPSMLGYIP